MARYIPAIFLVCGCCTHIAAENSVRVALTTKVSQALQQAYKGSTAKPWAKPGSPPLFSRWKDAAKTKYMATESAAAGYEKLNSLDKRFRNVALAVSMDWELLDASTYSLLQAAYENVHPWRTGQVVQKNRTDAEGNRFAAITSAVGDVLLMELTKEAMLLETGVLRGRWPNFPHALFFGQFQEIVAEQGLTQKDWQLYPCDAERNPIMISHNSTSPDVHFVPQLTWITMPLDMAMFLGDVLSGESHTRWAAYEKRGAALWQEYKTVHRPVVRNILDLLQDVTSDEPNLKERFREALRRNPSSNGGPLVDELIEQSKSLVVSSIEEYRTTGAISTSTYQQIRALYLSVGIGSNTTCPPTPTCTAPDVTSTSAAFEIFA